MPTNAVFERQKTLWFVVALKFTCFTELQNETEAKFHDRTHTNQRRSSSIRKKLIELIQQKPKMTMKI